MREYDEEVGRYLRRIVQLAGRPRKEVRILEDHVKLRFDRAGGLGSVPILMELAAGVLTTMMWEAIEEQPPSGWWGDLEPGSPGFRMERQGPKIEPPGGFRHEPPPFEPSLALPSEPGARFFVTIEGEGERYTNLSGNGEAFITLAKHMVYLGQDHVPIGSRIDYAGSEILEVGSMRLVLERANFPKDVPWAFPPTVGKKP